MRKIAGYAIIFILGFGVCMLMLRANGFRITPGFQAQRNVLAILDRPTAGAPIPTSALVQAAAKIEPCVVNIDTLVTGQARLLDFLGNPYSRPFALQGKGSGVIISPDGYIVTNDHVIEGANVIRVTLPDGKQYSGRVTGTDPTADIAVVKIEAANLPSAELGDSSRLKVGEYVLAIGYPLGIGTTVTHGIVSATDRRNLEIGDGKRLKEAIQTDAPINKGNSGGALANLNGQLVGINAAIFTENHGGNIGIGFAIPINGAREVLREIIARGDAKVTASPFLGIMHAPIGPGQAAMLNLPPGVGMMITQVLPLTSAAAAGLKSGDVLLTVDGKTVGSTQQVKNAIVSHQVGDQVTVCVMHSNGNRQDVRVTLGQKTEPPPRTSSSPERSLNGTPGFPGR